MLLWPSRWDAGAKTATLPVGNYGFISNQNCHMYGSVVNYSCQMHSRSTFRAWTEHCYMPLHLLSAEKWNHFSLSPFIFPLRQPKHSNGSYNWISVFIMHTLTNSPLAISVCVKINSAKMVSHTVITTQSVVLLLFSLLNAPLAFYRLRLFPPLPSLAVCHSSLYCIWRISCANVSPNWLSLCAQKCEATSSM